MASNIKTIQVHEFMKPCTVLQTICKKDHCTSYLVSAPTPDGADEIRILQVFSTRHADACQDAETGVTQFLGSDHVSRINGSDGVCYLLIKIPYENCLQWKSVLQQPLDTRLELISRLIHYLTDMRSHGVFHGNLDWQTFFTGKDGALRSWDFSNTQCPKNTCVADLALLAAQAIIGKAVTKENCLLQLALALHEKMPPELLQNLIQTVQSCLQGNADLSALQEAINDVPDALELHEFGDWDNTDPSLAAASFLQKERNQLWRYVRKTKNGDAQLRIVLAGKSPMRKAFLDTIIPCAQMLDTQMHIRIIAEDASAFCNEYLKKAPLLSQAVQITHIPEQPGRVYALNEAITGRDRNNTVAPLAYLTFENKASPNVKELRNYDAGCILLLDTFTLQHRQDLMQLTAKYAHPLLIGLKDPVPQYQGLHRHVFIDSFAQDPSREPETLDVYQQALTVHTFYTKEYAQRTPWKKILSTFRSKYNRNSSIRSTLSIPYKLYAYGLCDCEDKSTRFYHEVLCDNQRASRLIWLEHRSWQAHLMVNGWHLNTNTFEQDFAQHKHTLKDRRWHACLFGSNDTGNAPLASWTPEDWSHADLSALDPLDKMSVTVHRLLTRHVEQTVNPEIKSVFSKLKTRLSASDFQQLQDALHGLQTNITNSRVGWNRVFEDLKWNLKQEPCEETERLLKAADGLARFIQNRNCRQKYKKLDEAIISAIPYLLEKDSIRCIYKLFSPQPWENLASSFFIEPAELILLTSDGQTVSSTQQKDFLNFLQNRRHIRTKLRTLPLGELKNIRSHAVLDVTGADTELLLAATKQLADRNVSIPMIRYQGEKLHVLSGNCPLLQFYRCHQSLTAEETMAVTGTKVLSENGNIPMHHMDRYEDLWKAVQQIDKYSFVSEFLADHTRTYKVLATKYLGRVPLWKTPFDKNVADQNGLLALLTALETACVIEKFEWNHNGDHPNIKATNPRCQDRLNKLLDAYCLTPNPRLFHLSFKSDDQDALCVLENQTLDFSEKLEYKKEKDLIVYKVNNATKTISGSTLSAALDILEQSGLIQRVNPQKPIMQDVSIRRTENTPNGTKVTDLPGKHICFRYSGAAAKSCLTKAGNALEALAYHTIRQMDKFDDVKLGVSILWGEQIEPGTPTQNEIDLVCTKGTKSYFISCKNTSKLNAGYITEIRYETDRFGVDGTAILLTTAKEEENLAAYARARRMGIEVITLKDSIDPGKAPENSRKVLEEKISKISG